MANNKFHIDNTILPPHTKHVLGNLAEVDNFALKLNKCVNWFEKDTFNSGVPIVTDKKLGEAKLDALKYKLDKKNNTEFIIEPDFSKVEVKKIRENNSKNAQKLCAKVAIVNSLKAEWRMVIGIGNESVHETSMTLHHIYGIPYIPASSIKGVIRSWLINENYNSEEEDALKDPSFVEIFGSSDAEGKVIFFDAFPMDLSKDSVQADIINPHYPDYYGGDKTRPPADWQSPKPIFFLTLKGTNFEFTFGVKNSTEQALLEKITQPKNGWLVRALAEHGIGAKTAVGYGYMYEEQPAPEPEKVVPAFLGKNQKSIPRNAEAEGILTKIDKKAGRTEYLADIYIREGDIRPNIKINGIRGEIAVGAVIEVNNIQPDKKGEFKEATLKGIKTKN